MAIFPFVLYVFIRFRSWFVQQLLMLKAILLFEEMGLHDHHKELHLDVFFDVFRGRGTNLWILNIELAFWKKSELIVGIVKKKRHKSKSCYKFSLKKKAQCKNGKKLWESKDEKLWVHDLFDELTKWDESFLLEARFALKLFCY